MMFSELLPYETFHDNQKTLNNCKYVIEIGNDGIEGFMLVVRLRDCVFFAILIMLLKLSNFIKSRPNRIGRLRHSIWTKLRSRFEV